MTSTGVDFKAFLVLVRGTAVPWFTEHIPEYITPEYQEHTYHAQAAVKLVPHISMQTRKSYRVANKFKAAAC